MSSCMAIEVGSIVEGKVTGITRFGAFVDLGGGLTGLVHISEVADTYVRDIKEHLKENDVVRVKVINVRDGKIGLSIRQADPNSKGSRRAGRARAPKSFEDKLQRFMRESEERQSALRKKSESRRGGRGARSF